MSRIVPTLFLVLVLGCSTTGGPGWTPEDCAQDVRLLEMIAERITQLIDQGRTVSQADWDRYSKGVDFLAAVGCPYVPKEWDRTPAGGAEPQ